MCGGGGAGGRVPLRSPGPRSPGPCVSARVRPPRVSAPGSSKLFWALHETMRAQKKIAIAVLVARQQAAPAFVALEPQEEVRVPRAVLK